MKIKTYVEVSIRILVLGAIGFCMTFLSEILGPVFGDDLIHSCTKTYCRHGGMGGNATGDVIWSSRHLWYFWTLFILFLWSVVSFIMRLVYLLNREEV